MRSQCRTAGEAGEETECRIGICSVAVGTEAAQPIGVVLAGGAGRRLGGDKATAPLGGRPLIERPLGALAAIVGELAVVAKAATVLPPLPGVVVWREPDAPRHPLSGIVEALARSGGRSVLVCAVDLPFVSTETLRRLAAADGEVAVAGGQPLLGRFGPSVAAVLADAVGAGRPAREVVAGLDATVVAVPEAELFNVNTPADLAAAEARLAATRR